MDNPNLKPFVDRKSYEECHNSWCLSEKGELCRVKDFASTKYWGERVLVVYWYENETSPAYCATDVNESKLCPIDIGDLTWHVLQKEMMETYASNIQKEHLNSNLPNTLAQPVIKTRI